MLHYIELLRAFATVLVANSHFKGVYPNDILSFGGGFGLGLFYLISGYLLANIKDNERFLKWYPKKILRIYAPLFVVKAIYVLIGFKKIASIGDVIKEFLVPGMWFSFSMVIYYAFYYFFVKYIWSKYRVKALVGGFIFCMAGFIILFVTRLPIATFTLENLSIKESFSVETPYLITQFLWLGLMLLGFTLRKYPECRLNKVEKLSALLGIVLSVLLFGIVKLMTRRGGAVNVQVLLLPSYVLFPYSLLLLARHYDVMVGEFLKTVPGKVIGTVSTCSLDIYYIQFFWIDSLKRLVFPLNLVLLFISIVGSAMVIHRICGFLYTKLTKRLEI